jgi:hypothetical protein
MKFFAYFGGEVVLDELINTCSLAKPKSADAASLYLSSHAHATVRNKLAITAQTLQPDDPRLAAELLRIHSYRAAKAFEADEDRKRSPIDQHLEAFLAGVGKLYRVGDEAVEHNGPQASKLNAYEQSAVELRDEEKTALADGLDIDDLPDPDTVLPPPQSRTQSPAP